MTNQISAEFAAKAEHAMRSALLFKEQLARPTGADILVTAPGGKRFKVSVRADNDRARLLKKARVYVHGPGDDADTEAVLGGFAKLVGSETANTPRGKFPALDKAWDALNGWIVEQKTLALAEVMDLLVDDGEELMKGAKFSRKAGCACGCSPGFVVEGLPSNRDVWVEEVRS